MMPNDLPPWPAVYQRQRWLRAGCFEALVHDPPGAGPRARRRAAQPTAMILDSRTLQSTPESGRAPGDGAKRRKGSKVHAAVDTLGHLLALHVRRRTADPQVGALAAAVREITGRPSRSAMSSGYRRRPGGGRRRPWLEAHSEASGASCCCRGAGSSNAASPGPLSSAGPRLRALGADAAFHYLAFVCLMLPHALRAGGKCITGSREALHR